MSITFNLYRNPNDGNKLLGAYPNGDKPIQSLQQLPVGNYVDRVADPELIFPRPDSETPAWAKHRRHHPSVPYRVPIGVSFGSWPFYFEAITMPTGATVGSWLTASGDKLIVGADYGVVEWLNPTVGNHSFHIKVYFQDGYAPLDVQWTLEVTTVGTIFIDPVSGNDSTGDGTIGNPFQTCDAWWKNDLTDITYSQYQVCYRGGTHNPAVTNTNTGVSGSNWRLMDNDKPLVHYGHPSEAVTFNMSSTAITVGFSGGQGTGPNSSDFWFSGITTQGMQDVASPKLFAVYGDSGDRTYTTGQGKQRITFFENNFTNATLTQDSSDNGGILWTPNPDTSPDPDKKNHYWLFSRNTMNNIHHTGTGHGNFNGFYVSGAFNHLVEHLDVINCTLGYEAYHTKTTAIYVCQRNVDYTQSPMVVHSNIMGSYDLGRYGGPYEYSYCRFNAPADATGHLLLLDGTFYADYDPNNVNHFPYYLVRCTFNYDKAESGWIALLRSDWPFYMYGCFCQVDDMWYDLNNQENENSADANDFVQVPSGSNAFDASLDLQGTYRTSYLGQFGAEVAE